MVVVLSLLLLLLFSCSPAAPVADEEQDEFTVLDMSSLKPHSTCSGHRVMPPHNSSWVPLYRPLGPCSPSFKGTAAKPPSLAAVLRQDRLRVLHIHRRASPGGFRVSKGSRKDPVTVEETQVHYQAAIKVTIGSSSSQSIGPADDGDGSSPAVTQTVVLDTASDVPWVQCLPCTLEPCPYYDPTRSSTYAAFPCNSSACKQLGPYANGCVNGQCQYRVLAADGSVASSGTYSSDLLTINSGNAVSSFRFGCSSQQSADDQAAAGGNTNADGTMALGRGAQSLAAQTSATYGNAFSYCLPPTDAEKGFFRIGVPGGAAHRFAMTPMLRDRRGAAAMLYRAALVAVTVNGRPLNVAPEAFAAGAVLDSVTVITRLPLTAYAALRAAFRDRMAAYRRAPAQEGLDTCYDLAGVRLPRVPRLRRQRRRQRAGDHRERAAEDHRGAP